MSDAPFPLVAQRGKTRKHLRATVKRSQKIIKSRHRKRAPRELIARRQAKTSEELTKMLERIDEDFDKSEQDRSTLGLEEVALVRNGFPSDFWLSWEVAREWRSNLYPKVPTREAVKQWQTRLKQIAARAFVGDIVGTATRILDDLAHDLELLRQYDPEIIQQAMRKAEGGDLVFKAGDENAEKGGDGEHAEEPLRPSREKAYRLFQWAMEQNPNLKTDRDVYDWLNERTDVPEELPNFPTWSKYLRESRAHHGDHKHTPRTKKRPSGKSVVLRDQI